MVGFLLQDCALPHSGYGHIFLGSPAPILAYSVGPGQVRIMFDIPDNPDGIGALTTDPSYLQAIPENLRRGVQQEMARENRLVSANYVVIPKETVRGRLVLVGDAGGCCHPLTATGLSVSSRDALRLREALKESGGDVDRALHAYELSRRGPQRVRLTLATALYEVFASQSPQMVLLRNGLVRYWSRDPAGRAASMALLSTWENRMSIMAQEYARVLLYGLTTGLNAGNGDSPVVELGKRGRAAVDLSWQFLKTVHRSLQIP
jgi:2-polyprenyl-6-methoxyphenol hydroxylase-like FAD-dependent oxidoreductase